MKHFWIEFDNPFQYENKFWLIGLEFSAVNDDNYIEIIVTVMNIRFHYLRPKGKL
jgi:hypothetical protein